MKPLVLLVDDEESVRNLVGHFLSERNYEVTTATTAAEALRLVNEVPLHLLILDVVLPDSDGIEVLERVKTSHPHLPVILFSGAGFDELLLREAREKGADGYASKTLGLEQLLMEVHRVLKQYKKDTVFRREGHTEIFKSPRPG